jgi:5'-nucleotidase
MNKSLVYGTFLYDDYLPYMEAWLKHRPRGLGIMPVTRSNRDFRHPQVVKWDGTNFDEVKRALTAAYARGSREPLVL